MIALIQVTDGVKLSIDDKVYNETTDKTLLVLLGVKDDDTIEDVDYIVKKIPKLRIFKDDEDKLNLSALDVGASLFVVSQFTLYAKCRKGNRPSFDRSAGYEKGKEFYEMVVDKLKSTGLEVKTGSFGAMMDIEFNNNGPVTIILDSNE
ncbi:D-tyrosyl-tRNA(Tyr) deacylase [Ezakiella coagulans]|uniref:D-aminoacyl-tRNA deacylase n=1 Tax=Ezakiella coagulans TaxID=46507 RepID=A0A2U1E2N3_9FIRM|nr:D-aminoacyl-tRNA deacylase [Ezakiella coagulans]PVY94155.1 D-tyrosyl-tRNA(Tyr) deacylase [Ezakiella coagulans]